MERIPVSSSDLHSVGYDAASQVLEVEFLRGGIYQYFDVPQHAYDGLMSANSHGIYFAGEIKGVYRYARL